MNCLSLTRKRPARGKTKRADNTMTIWTNEWSEKGQLPSMGESRSRAFETQKDEHNVTAGMPDTRMPMMISRMKFFLVRFIYCGPLCRQCFEAFSKRPFLPKLYVRLSCCPCDSFFQKFFFYTHIVVQKQGFYYSSFLYSICRGTMVSFEFECIPRIINRCPTGQITRRA